MRFVLVILRGILIWIPLLLSAQDNETCLSCHDDESLAVVKRGIEISLYVTDENFEGTPHEGFECIDCHEELVGVDDFPHDPMLELPYCGNCHEDAQTEFIEGFFQPLRDKGYTSLPSCTDCHSTHNVSWTGKPRQVCGICHRDILNDFLNSAHWDQTTQSSDVTCVSCHSPHNKHERSSFTEVEWKLHITESCRGCHEEKVINYDLSGHYQQLAAGNLRAPVCSDCHAKHRVLSPRNSESIVSVARLDQVCSTCHGGYENSIHRPEIGDDPRLETCVVCHTGHETEMVGTASTSVFDIKLDQVCIRCHSANLIVGKGEAHGNIHREELSKIEQGIESNCGNCHTYHFMAPEHPSDTALEKSCKDCHFDKQAEYELSTHFVSKERGHEEAPGCVDCHDERRIKKSQEQFLGQSIIELCSRCHGNRELTMKFQLNSEVIIGYGTSYHGQMYQLGYQGEAFATCVSCHDNHAILPSDHELSTIGKSRIVETCSKCHEDANENFVQYLQHYTPHDKERNPLLTGINTFMIWLLGSVLFIFGGHTLLWLTRLIILRIKEGPIKKPTKTKYRVRRFSKNQRLLHLGMILSFLTLAATGLPLKYSHSPAANWVVHHVVGFGTAAALHRIAAILLIVVFAIHLAIIFYKVIVRRDKGIFWGPNSLVSSTQDVKDFINHIGYFVGLKKKPPKFGRWAYWEKFDYYAVFWGMIVIGLSGLTLWFPEQLTRLLPGWLINVAHIVHSEEALLATAFIFTVHFFNTHLRPGVFPMDEVIFTGRVTEEHFKEERALEYESLTEEEYKARLTAPLPRWMKKLFYVAGYTFLSIGVLLLIFIIIGTFF
jgi:cytochrome b subunit of formate dehydrogenase